MNTDIQIPTVDELHEEWVKAEAKYSGPRGIIQFCLDQLTPLLKLSHEREEFEKWHSAATRLGPLEHNKETLWLGWQEARKAKP